MKIYGIGIDIVNIYRFNRSLKKKGLIKRLFNKNEILKCNNLANKGNCYSKRFAAKEAFAKATGLGISKGINFNEIVVLNANSGKPNIILIGKTKKIINNFFKKKKIDINLSLSDDEPFAIASVIISL
tara:strand:+ start:324 stop:707 length:384 start_codon:yes stop_codon:yes gene_type:complete